MLLDKNGLKSKINNRRLAGISSNIYRLNILLNNTQVENISKENSEHFEDENLKHSSKFVECPNSSREKILVFNVYITKYRII